MKGMHWAITTIVLAIIFKTPGYNNTKSNAKAIVKDSNKGYESNAKTVGKQLNRGYKSNNRKCHQHKHKVYSGLYGYGHSPRI